MLSRPRTLTTTLLGLGAAALLAGCATDSGASNAALTVTDPWVKTAVPEDMMSAAFGTLTNASDEDVTVVAATSESFPSLELHEVVDGTMQPVDGGFEIPAGESLNLEPGGFHIMVMELPEAIEAGDQVDFTLELSTGETVDFTATAKDFDGGNESYHDGDSMDMESMDAAE